MSEQSKINRKLKNIIKNLPKFHKMEVSTPNGLMLIIDRKRPIVYNEKDLINIAQKIRNHDIEVNGIQGRKNNKKLQVKQKNNKKKK